MGSDESNEEGSHEAPCHEGSSASQGHEGNEEGCHGAPCHEGSSASQGYESDEEGCDEAPCHEGSSASQGHEGHEVNAFGSSAPIVVISPTIDHKTLSVLCRTKTMNDAHLRRK